MNITVQMKSAKLEIGIYSYLCAIGKNGYIEYDLGREGDGKTPLGQYPIRYGYYREDRLSEWHPIFEACDIEFRPTKEEDGWCDAPTDPHYNRPVILPYGASTEKMYRDDALYDVVLVLGHNDNPPVGGEQALGSAIFIHIAKDNYKPTEGCVAIAREHMLEILPLINRETIVTITE